METGYFLCVDVLGFSNIVKNLSHEQLDEKITEWTDLVSETAKKNKIDRFQLISDTVFVGVGGEKNDLKRLVSFGRELLNQGVSKSLPVRGAITCGEYTWGQRQVYGRAVIDAHILERKQNWVGITLCSKINLIGEDYTEMGVVLYAAPLRGCLISTCKVISWNVPSIEELMKKLTAGGLTVDKEPLDWSWGDKVSNTVLFGLYLEVMLKHNGQQPDFFAGLHPVHFIDTIFRNPLQLKT